jgi:hypothetical protein
MGQYHILINRDAGEHVFPHTLGNGLKAWEQTAGAIPAALVFLLAARPGNAPGDVGHHPLAGRWAGQRILAAGDYAEDGDIPGFGRNPPLSCIYHLCTDPPDPGEQRTPYNKVTTTRSGKKIHRTVTPEMQYREEVREFIRLTRKYRHLPNLAPQLQGPIEHALSVRFVATSTRTFHDVPVKPFAIQKEDGELHYELPERLLRPQTGDDHWELGVIWRMCGLGGWRDNPAPDPLNLPEGLARWPWDRAPKDMTFHNASDADQDLGQQRVYANLDRREFFDPIFFGEVPTTLGLMRAAASCPPQVPDIVIGGGKTTVAPKLGRRLEFSSAACLWAMLLHPESRGGGDIEPTEFPEIGRWRHDSLLLTSDYDDSGTSLPSTGAVRQSFRDISAEVFAAARAATRALGGCV